MTLPERLREIQKQHAEQTARELRQRFGEQGIEVVEKADGYVVRVTNERALTEEFGKTGGDAKPWLYGLLNGSGGSHHSGGDGADHG